MQIIFQKLIIRWQPYPSWKQRTWSSHWCSALRALLFGLILAEMDALSALAGRDFRSSCTITEPICQQSPNWGWQLCVPERVTLQKQGCCCFPWSWERCHRPQPTLPCPSAARNRALLGAPLLSAHWHRAAARGAWSWFIACFRDFTGPAPAFSQAV